jgi:hypothetical protein
VTNPVNLVEERAPNVNRDPPDWIVREIRKVGGNVSDLSGVRPRFRVIWGGSRWMTAADEMTLIRPYRLDMWHLEKLHEGEYEHCYRLGECPTTGPPHRKLAKDPWCRQCFMDGGVPMKIEGCWAFVEGIIRLIMKTEDLQKTTRFAAQQKDALFGREDQRDDARTSIMRDAVADAAPVTVKRSFETPLRLSADQALGRRKGLRQLNSREIIKGLRGKKARKQ